MGRPGRFQPHLGLHAVAFTPLGHTDSENLYDASRIFTTVTMNLTNQPLFFFIAQPVIR
jgi:hypothetical protein